MPSSRDDSPLKLLSQQLLHLEAAGLPTDEFTAKLKDVARDMSNMMERRAACFLGGELNVDKHTEKQVKSFIDTFPRALSIRDSAGVSPVEVAACRLKSIPFFPLLAQESYLRNTGGGGDGDDLLRGFHAHHRNADNEENYNGMPYGMKLLMKLVINPTIEDRGTSQSYRERQVLEVFKKLKAMGLLRKKDIQDAKCLELALFGCSSSLSLLADFFADMDPDYLKREGVFPMVIRHGDFGTMLKITMKHFSNEMGLLFNVCNELQPSIECAVQELGEDKTMEIVRMHIPPSDNHPILHQVIQHAPKLMNLFSRHYPDAIYLRDSDNRTLFLTSLAKCKRTFDKDPVFFLKATDYEVAEMDPVTELFPFALAATEDTSDLEAVYKLLRRDPGLVLGESRTKRSVHLNRKRKRGA